MKKFFYFSFPIQQQAGLTKRVVSIEDIANLAHIEAPKKRRIYKKKEVK